MESETVTAPSTVEHGGSLQTKDISFPFQTDTLLVTQFFEDRRGKTRIEPEKRLMLAVLEDAFYCFEENCAARNGKRKQLFENVQRWFFETNVDWVFGFENICSVLDLDPEYVRKGLLHLREKELSKRRRAPAYTPYEAGAGMQAR